MDTRDYIAHYADYHQAAIESAKAILIDCDCMAIPNNTENMVFLKPDFVIRAFNDKPKKAVYSVKVIYRPNSKAIVRDKKVLPSEMSLITAAHNSNFILFIYSDMKTADDLPALSIRYSQEPICIKKADDDLELGAIVNCKTLENANDRIVRLAPDRAKHYWQDWLDKLQAIEDKYARK
ncbi:MAG: hypothetical protein WCO55_05115 [Candidatus Falkowbacteria bacterium]